VEHARVIHTGLDFPDPGRPAAGRGNGRPALPLKLLYAGRLSVEKGVDTAILALAELSGRPGEGAIPAHLSIAGAGGQRYERELRELVKQFKLEKSVSFLGRRPLEEMPELMASCDVLVVPSRWPEPFARVVMEGMHSRMAVLATPVGGSTEIVEDGVNGLFFPAGDSITLAAQIRTLIENPERRTALAEAGHETVTTRFSRGAMLDAIEAFLIGAAAGARRG
jgi:glycogen(starch) synthase